MALHEELKEQGDYLFKNRSWIPMMIVAIGLVVFIDQKSTNHLATHSWNSELFYFTCLGISLFGLAVRVLTIGYSPNNTSGRNTKEGQIAEELNTTGLYSLARHPLYLGNFFMWLGVAMLTENTWFVIAFILFFALYYERIMYAEESFLRQKFKSTYLDWATKTPIFIPSLKHYKKAKYPFSLKKTLKQEKTGLVALFLLFWAFRFTGDSIKARSIEVKYDFWFYSALGSLVLYIVLKIMKKSKFLTETNH